MKNFAFALSFLLSGASFAQDWKYWYLDGWNESLQDWNLGYRSTTTYSAPGKPDSIIFHQFYEQSWTYMHHTTYVYDTGGLMIERYSPQSGSGVQKYKALYFYNNENRLSEERLFEWIGMQWVEIRHFLYSYNQAGELNEKLMENLEDGVYYPDSRNLYEYDSSGLLTEWRIEILDDNGQWDNFSRETYTYTPTQKRATSLFQYHFSLDWENEQREFFEYDENDSLLVILRDIWNYSEEWEHSKKIDCFYDNDGFRNLEIEYHWFDEWRRGFRRRFENEETVLTIEDGVVEGILIYPNPVKDKLNIDTGNIQTIFANFVDVTGRTVTTTEKSPETTYVSTENIPAGVYNVVFSSENGQFTKRIVKL